MCDQAEIDLELDITYEVFGGQVVIREVYIEGEAVTLPPLALEQLAEEIKSSI